MIKKGSEGGYEYEYAEGDPTMTRIYTLENGLKVYLSDYEAAPRVQVYIPVKAGGKNDPADNTGLAHYLEHMMFKGTDTFGTLNYEEEKVMLDSIEYMFNHYATLVDDDERKEYYAQIDAYSNRAAELAIPNEFDKMIALIGGKGLNAYTTEDRTVYTVDIPSNEIERFLEIEGNRFRTIVNRLFHTELEAVYEEKNRSLDNDGWKVIESLYAGLFPNHQYGTQTVIGTIEHLKNPSITEIKNYFNKYYRPNNVAICMSGDIDFTETITLIDKYFGTWEPNQELKPMIKIEEPAFTAPVELEVFGPSAEFLYMGYRLDGTSSDEYIKAQLADMILNNSEAGLIDLNLKQQQKVLNAGSGVQNMNDYSIQILFGNAKNGQSLEEVRDLLVEQINLLKNGEFDDWLIPAVIADFKKSKMRALESNNARANDMVMAFTNDMEWGEYIKSIEKMEKITKEELVAFANEKYNDNYVIVYKRAGEDPSKQSVEKPQITKVPVNREAKSDFHKYIDGKEVGKLQPVFVNYNEDVSTTQAQKVNVISKENKENELFELTYLLDMGSATDAKLGIAAQYLEFLGTETLSSEELKKEFYKIGCSFSVSAGNERTYVTLSGLDENMESATALLESLIATAVADQEALDKMIDRMLKSRADAKKNKGLILRVGLVNYGKYGADNPFTNVLSNSELQKLEAEELVAIVKGLTKMPHRILYYGPRSESDLKTFLQEFHSVPESFNQIPEPKVFEEVATNRKVYWTDYDMVQTEIVLLAKGGEYDMQNAPEVRMYNQYFGGGMNSIVFQEIREAQGLAYAVSSSYSTPNKKGESHYQTAYIGTQADKQAESMDALMDLINNMPESPEAFDIAKKAILNKIESERVVRSGVIWNYISAQDKGHEYDIRKDIYEKVKTMNFEDLKAFHEEYVKGKDYTIVLIGSKDKIDFNALSDYGDITELSLEEIFGYEDSESVIMN